MLAMSMLAYLLFKFWDFYQVFPGGREVRVSERIRTRETLAYRPQCTAAARLHTVKQCVAQLPLLTLGEYKFGINWFSAKMWSVKPRKIKTPGGGNSATSNSYSTSHTYTMYNIHTYYICSHINILTLFTILICCHHPAPSSLLKYTSSRIFLLSILSNLSPRCELKFLLVSTTDICWGQNWRYVSTQK